MNCQRFEEIVSELGREQLIQADLRTQALAHSDACPACMVRLRQEETLTRGLQALALEMRATVVTPVDLELRLRQAFRTRESLPWIASTRGYGRYWLSAAAAVLLIVCSVIAIRWRSEKPAPQVAVEPLHTAPVREPDERVTPAPEIVATVAKGPSKPANANKKPIRTSLAVRNRRLQPSDTANVAAVNNTQREIATEFMPLGYLNSANLQDGGQIVRVELPRSALANFGIPVNPDRYNEKVKADIVLGVDGLAHAIRFVQ
jgi:hypothetical protein